MLFRSGDLVGGHAYTVSGYNSSTGKFTLHNPWGFSHPAPLTWSQLVSSCSAFVVVNPSTPTATSSPLGGLSVSARVWSAVTRPAGLTWSDAGNAGTTDTESDWLDEGSASDSSSIAVSLTGQTELNPAGLIGLALTVEERPELEMLSRVNELLETLTPEAGMFYFFDPGFADLSAEVPR